MGAMLLEKDPDLFINITDSITSMENYDSINYVHPYITCMIAQANGIQENYETSINAYRKAFELCCSHEKFQDTTTSLNFSGEFDYQLLASVCKMEEGMVHLLQGDTSSAMDCFHYSSILDSNFRREVLLISQALKYKSLDGHVYELPECFTYLNKESNEDSIGPYYKVTVERKPVQEK